MTNLVIAKAKILGSDIADPHRAFEYEGLTIEHIAKADTALFLTHLPPRGALFINLP
jgi:hypothetical protein